MTDPSHKMANKEEEHNPWNDEGYITSLEADYFTKDRVCDDTSATDQYVPMPEETMARLKALAINIKLGEPKEKEIEN